MNAQLQMTAPAHTVDVRQLKTKTYQGGTVWAVGALLVSLVASARMWTLVPGAIDRFAYGACPASASSVQLSWPQVISVLVGGLLAIVLAEFGVRRQGNRWIAMVASVIGVSLILGGAALSFALVAPPIPCT